ncbi:hypothetical protein CRN61_23485 [Vibrio vulnificus]|nr:hypothetical protein FORC37_1291 [Vibrio vulnificus]PNG64757.1 hypothetical protein SC81_09660 [Vibrio vulnificus]POC10123.1 hypothetical protein CRN54_12390 [Vibrio vulnificus]POC77173.1 hypothetical protein CRN61_23485 [Vibrio vulnificus]HAS8179103.1 hypothetical protein [Vibrio vulnificus]
MAYLLHFHKVYIVVKLSVKILLKHLNCLLVACLATVFRIFSRVINLSSDEHHLNLRLMAD